MVRKKFSEGVVNSVLERELSRKCSRRCNALSQLGIHKWVLEVAFAEEKALVGTMDWHVLVSGTSKSLLSSAQKP